MPTADGNGSAPTDSASPTESSALDADATGTGGPVASDGVDFAWVMQVTFVGTIIVGAPVVALLSVGVRLPTWESRVSFAVRVGAVVWLLTATIVLIYAHRRVSRDQ